MLRFATHKRSASTRRPASFARILREGVERPSRTLPAKKQKLPIYGWVRSALLPMATEPCGIGAEAGPTARPGRGQAPEPENILEPVRAQPVHESSPSGCRVVFEREPDPKSVAQFRGLTAELRIPPTGSDHPSLVSKEDEG